MKSLKIIITALLLSGVVYAAQDSSLSIRQVRDPVQLRSKLNANALDAETRIAAIEGGTATVTLDANKILVGNDASNQTAMAVAGDVTITQDGTNVTTAIAEGVIVDADINADAGIVSTKLSADTQTSLGLADTSVQPADVVGVADFTIAAVDQAGLTNVVSMALKDVDNEAANGLASYWISTTDGGAASTNNIVSISVTEGTSIVTEDAAVLNAALSSAGAIDVTVVMTASGTNYLNAAVGGVYKSVEVVTAD